MVDVTEDSAPVLSEDVSGIVVAATVSVTVVVGSVVATGTVTDGTTTFAFTVTEAPSLVSVIPEYDAVTLIFPRFLSVAAASGRV